MIVIDVETSSSGMPSNAVRMSSSVSIATPVRPDLAEAARVVGVQPELRRQVEGHAQAGRAVREQVLVALVGLLRRRVARVLAHRPAPLAVHLRVHAARVRELPGLPQIQVLGQVRARVQRLDLDARIREAARIIGADDRRHGQIRRRVLVLDGHGRQVTRGTLTGVSLGRDAPPLPSSPPASRRCSPLRPRAPTTSTPPRPAAVPTGGRRRRRAGRRVVTRRSTSAIAARPAARSTPGPADAPTSPASPMVTWALHRARRHTDRRLLAVAHAARRRGSWN